METAEFIRRMCRAQARGDITMRSAVGDILISLFNEHKNLSVYLNDLPEDIKHNLFDYATDIVKAGTQQYACSGSDRTEEDWVRFDINMRNTAQRILDWFEDRKGGEPKR